MTSQQPLSVLLEQKMAHATKRDVHGEPLSSAISRLSAEGERLLLTRRHDWVRTRTTELVDSSNWPAYSMEVHLTAVLENEGYMIRNSVQLISGDASDVDIVYHDINGVQLQMECVFALEPLSYWQENFEVMPGAVISVASYDGEGEAGLLRRVQHKMRVKAAKQKNLPIKFPLPNATSLNILTVDVSQGLGDGVDAGDLGMLTLGRNHVHPIARREALGLFEQSNPYGSNFDKEFIGNQHFRERVHAVLFLLDESSWHSPLNPRYAGYYVCNPALHLNQRQKDSFVNLGNMLTDKLVTQGWLSELSFQPVL